MPERTVAGHLLDRRKRGMPRVRVVSHRVLQPRVRVEFERDMQAVHRVRGVGVQLDERVRDPLLLLQRDRHAELHAALDRLCVHDVPVQNLADPGCVSEVPPRVDRVWGLLRGVRAGTVMRRDRGGPVRRAVCDRGVAHVRPVHWVRLM